MNLVSYEYISCQSTNHGVLILSEFAGAAQSLNGSIIVNPWSTNELMQSIHEAVTMPEATGKANHGKLFRYVNKYTAAFWGLSFVKEMQKCVGLGVDGGMKVARMRIDDVKEKFVKSCRKKVRLFFCCCLSKKGK